MTKANCCLLVVIDMQEKLLKAIKTESLIRWNVNRLCKAFRLLGFETVYTEQNPIKLGNTVISSSNENSAIKFSKMTFSAAKIKEFIDLLYEKEISDIILCGVEAHVCVMQTAIELNKKGFNVLIVADAVGSRHTSDKLQALKRMSIKGIDIVTTEMVIFEYTQTADMQEFKKISMLIKESSPVFE